tara:strand:- start:715 stop:1017 length:303 start_codon:yes stop_codon:yes gene_type:complete
MDKIHHIAIEVKEIEESIKWYSKNTNCKITYQDKTWAMIKYDNISLALVLPGMHPPHIAFEKHNAEEFGKLKEHRDGTSSVYIRDPANNAVEILKLNVES